MDRTVQISGFVKKEVKLLIPFIEQPWKEFTIADIKRISGNRSHHYVFEALKKFCKLGIAREKRSGNTNSYTANSQANPHIEILTLAESVKRDSRRDIPFANLTRISERIKNPFYIMLITGSYAEHKQTAKSDLDVAIIIPNSEQKKAFAIALKEGELMVPEVHGFVFTQDEFYQMLTNNEFNYGKEAARKHIIFYGAEQYYQILFEAMNHGFKG